MASQAQVARRPAGYGEVVVLDDSDSDDELEKLLHRPAKRKVQTPTVQHTYKRTRKTRNAAKPGITLDSFFGKGGIPARLDPLSKELGFDINHPNQREKMPDFVKRFDAMVKESMQVDQVVQEERQLVQEEEQRKQQIEQAVVGQLSRRFVRNPENADYIETLKRQLEDPTIGGIPARELTDFYFFCSRGNIGHWVVRMENKDLRTRLTWGSGQLVESRDSLAVALGCLAEESETQIISQYQLSNVIGQLDAGGLAKFIADLGCSTEVSAGVLPVSLDRKEPMANLALAVLKLRTVVRALNPLQIAGLLPTLGQTVCYMLADPHLGQSEAISVQAGRTTAVRMCSEILALLVSTRDNQLQLLEIVQRTLGTSPVLWFRLISSVAEHESDDLRLFKLRSMLSFVCSTGYNDVCGSGSPYELNLAEVETESQICAAFVDFMSFFQGCHLNGTVLKDGPTADPKPVNKGEFLANRPAYEVAKLRTLLIDQLARVLVHHLRGGVGFNEHRRPEDDRTIGQLKQWFVSLNKTYFFNLGALICPQATASRAIFGSTAAQLDEALRDLF